MAFLQTLILRLLTIPFVIKGFIWLVLAILKHPLSFYKKKSRKVPPALITDPSYGTHEYITANGIKFHCVCNGNPNKPLMLFLHGFPEFWYSWRYQLKYFCNDYRVMAIDMRGYGETDKPAGKENYTMEILKEDIVQLIKEVNPSKKCILVAHDWGGAIAWPVVQEHPELFEKFIVMNAPHGKVMAKAVRNGLKQLFKSWCPYLPEWLLSVNDYEFIRDIYKSKTNGLVNEGNFTEDDVEAYKYTFGQEGALTPPINYYRCAFSGQPRKPFKLIDTPTLLLWGADDVALDISLAEGHKDICTDISVKVINDCSHWVQQDCPETVNEYMKEFLEE